MRVVRACEVMCTMALPPGWRGGADGDGVGGEQISYLDSAEASATRDGFVQSGAAHLHTRTEVLPGQAVGLLLPRGLLVRVSLQTL